jgi:hypothetical protein
MKNLILLFIFLTLVSCKKDKSDPQPANQDASFAFQEFKVEGVSPGPYV